MDYVMKSIEDLKSTQSNSHENREESVLEKLIKIDKKVAVVMCIDSISEYFVAENHAMIT
jgi:hypothetical protein